MTTIGDTVFQELEQADFKVRTVSITRLPAVQEAVASLVRHGLASETLYRDWHFYLDTNREFTTAKTIFVIAIPQSVMRVKFERHGVSYPADVPPGIFVRADESRAAQVLEGALGPFGYAVKKAHLALKTLAVRSGLARYGKNNLAYVLGAGTFHRLVAFYSDCPCETDSWHEIRAMEACDRCSLCRENCPANSILSDRFLIRAENCQVFSSAVKDASWFTGGGRNALVGCMVCQNVCPANKPYLDKRADGPTFSAAETELIVNGMPCSELFPETQKRLGRLAEGEIYAALVQNLNCLLKSKGS
jgi:epoxyqueuosine reductase